MYDEKTDTYSACEFPGCENVPKLDNSRYCCSAHSPIFKINMLETKRIKREEREKEARKNNPRWDDENQCWLSCLCGCGEYPKGPGGYCQGHHPNTLEAAKKRFFEDNPSTNPESIMKRTKSNEENGNSDKFRKMLKENNPSWNPESLAKRKRTNEENGNNERFRKMAKDPEITAKSTKTKTMNGDYKRVGENKKKEWEKDHPSKRFGASERISKQRKQYLKKYPGELAEHIKIMCEAQKIKPNKPELKLLKILDQNLPGEYRYTGDFKFFIENKNPDYVNCNGQKKVIEKHGCAWHCCPVCSITSNPNGVSAEEVHKYDAEKVEIYKKYGFKTLTVWDHELEDTITLVDKILEFNEEGRK